MPKSSFSILIVVFLLSLSGVSFAQASRIYPDAGMWNTLTIEKKINKKITLSIDQELRLKENYSKINLFYTNLGFNYKFSKKIKVAIIYRNTQKADDYEGWSIKHRIMLDLLYKEKLSKKIYFAYRHRFQFENRDIFSSQSGRYIESFMRSKFEIGYNYSKKIKLYFSEELRYQFVDPANMESNFGWHRMRTALGIDYTINAIHSFGIYYIMQHEFLVYKPNQLYITGIQYGIQL